MLKLLKNAALLSMSNRRRFQRLYRRGGWGSDESVSGPGSTVLATENVRNELPKLIIELNIKTMVDAPCGDFHWMNEIFYNTALDVDYLGVDIVPDLVADNKKKWAADKIKFLEADILRDVLPDSDLIICRHCLIHFSNVDISIALRNFRRSGAKYLLTSSYRNVETNEDILTGRYRPVNLQIAPFDFEPPLTIIAESGGLGQFLGLWKLDELCI